MLELAIHSQHRHQQFAIATGSLNIDEWIATELEFWAEDLVGIGLAVQLDSDQSTVTVNNSGEELQLPWLDRKLNQGSSELFQLPLQLRRGRTTIELRASCATKSSFHRIRNIQRGENNEPSVPVDILGQSPGATTLARWFESLGKLQRSVAGSQEFFDEAVQAVIQPGGLDVAMLIMKQDEAWTIRASHVTNPGLGVGYCREFVEKVAEKRQTFFHEDVLEEGSSENDSIVVSPVLTSDGSVIGVLYGVRSSLGNNLRRCIRPLEALWVQLVAEAITGAVVRMDAEANATRTRVLFEQAFSGRVVRKLIEDPTILQGKELDVTVLFADLREFTSISEGLGAKETYRFLGEFLEHLTDCVLTEGGVVIDYYGDGLACMWNAPTRQPDHAIRACRAALKMQAGLQNISRRWIKSTGKELNLGIGINTGRALVGNAGTQRRMKYGPRGTTVNIASRVESATKRLGSPILITSSTLDQLGEDALAPRMGQGRLRGINKPVEMFQLISLGNRIVERHLIERLGIYEESLQLYESGEIEEALALLEANRPASDEAPTDRSCEDFLYEHLREQNKTPTGNVFDLT